MFKLQTIIDNKETVVKDPIEQDLFYAFDLSFNKNDSIIILESSESIKNIPFIQTINFDGIYHTELCYDYDDISSFLYEKDFHDKSEVLQFFINYLEKKNVDFNDWTAPHEFYELKSLNKILKTNDLIGLNCSTIPQSERIILDNVTICDFLNYAKTNSINTIFYNYNGLNPNEYTLDDPKDQCGDLYDIAKAEISEYISMTQKIDFTKDAYLTIFCLNGSKIILKQFRHMITETENVRDFLDRLREKYSVELNNIKTNRENLKSELLEDLRNVLMTDKEFSFCSNQTLRGNYIETFLKKESNIKYAEAFKNDNGYVNMFKAKEFADYVFQMKKKLNKI